MSVGPLLVTAFSIQNKTVLEDRKHLRMTILAAAHFFT
jgi:hypothetical protein